MPMPCSAEIEPPCLTTMARTDVAALSSQRARKAALSAPTGWRDVVVNIAVADVAERKRPRARNQLRSTAAFASSMKAGTAATGTDTSCLIEPPSCFCTSPAAFADAPEGVGLLQRSRAMRAVLDEAFLHAVAEDRLPSASRRPLLARCDDSSISTYQGCALVERIARPRCTCVSTTSMPMRGDQLEAR